MSAPTLALFAAARADDEGAATFFQVLVALAASGSSLRLAAVGAGRGVLEGDAVSDEVERLLEGLTSLGLGFEVLEGEALAAALQGAEHILRLGAPERSGQPALLVLERGATPATIEVEAAGQVVGLSPPTTPDEQEA